MTSKVLYTDSEKWDLRGLPRKDLDALYGRVVQEIYRRDCNPAVTISPHYTPAYERGNYYIPPSYNT